MTDINDEELDSARRFYAEELRYAGGLKSEAVIEALARVPRERFLGPGPWLVLTPGQGYVETPDADPRHLYHNVLVAIDAARMLNNGHPSFLAQLIEATEASEGEHVVHVGCGTGYYSAILAELVGETGRVTAIELDPELAGRARVNLEPLPQVDVVCADGTTFDPGASDAFLVNAGATHPSTTWLDRMLPGARLILPLTVNAPIHGGGAVLKVKRLARGTSASFLSPVGIFPCVGARDEELNAKLGKAFGRGLEALAKVRSLRLDRHEEDESCWYHGDAFCVSTHAPG